MKAIILAAGLGRRMRHLSRDRHKTLLEVGGRTIIGRIIDGLQAKEISEIYIVTGYRATEVEDYVTKEFRDLKCTFILNSLYASTNNIYSMALALERADCSEGLLIIESDLVYEPAVLARLIGSAHPNVAVVARYRIGLDGTVVSVSDSNVITQVIPTSLQDVNFDFTDKFKTLNIYKFSAEFCYGAFRKLLTYYARTIDGECYYELVLGVLIYTQAVQIHAEILDDEIWAEVDDPNDLRVAGFALAPSTRRQYLESSWGGYWNTAVTDFFFIRNMYFPTPSMLSQLRAYLPDLVTSYGSSQAILDLKLAYFLSCEPKHVHLLNGASQFSPILRSWFRPERVLLPTPTFGEYMRMFPSASTYTDSGKVDFAEVERKAEDADLVVIVNPNNPTGTIVLTEEIKRLATRLRDKLILVDESFIEFSGQPSLIPWVEEVEVSNVLVLKSLSKTLGAPGLRLGCIFTIDDSLSDRVLRQLPVWNINSVAEHLLEMLLKYPDELDSSIRRTMADRELFAAALDRLDIVERVYPSGANFLLIAVSIGADEALQLADALLVQDNFFVKDVSSKFTDDRVYWRLAVRTPGDNERLCKALHSRSRR